MTTSTPVQVITAGRGISASDAHQAAGISYRQCDHWARRGWVRPSVDPGEGRSGRRLYSEEDVVRLDLLRHLAEAKVNTAVAGPLVACFSVPDSDVRVLWGPLGDEPELTAVPADIALEQLEGGGGWVVYNPSEVRTRIAVVTGQIRPGVDSNLGKATDPDVATGPRRSSRRTA